MLKIRNLFETEKAVREVDAAGGAMHGRVLPMVVDELAFFPGKKSQLAMDVKLHGAHRSRERLLEELLLLSVVLFLVAGSR